MYKQTAYQKLNVPEFESIQNEALEHIKKQYPELLRDDVNGYFVLSIDNFPILKSFLDPRVTTCIEEIGLNCVPPDDKLSIHIDGIRRDPDNTFLNQIKETIINHPEFTSLNLKTKLDKLPSPFCVQFAMIVPVLNYKDTISYWYSNDDVGDDDEVIWRGEREHYPYSYFYTSLKPNVVLNPINSTNIDRITFIKSDIFHNVHNRGTTARMSLTIKFGYQNYESLEEMFRHQDLL